MIGDSTEKREARKKKIQQARYAVGYGKTSVGTQFKPGKSGNPKGRPKGAKGLKTIVCNAAEATEEYTQKGKKRKGTRLEIGFQQLSLKAAGGDMKALQMLTQLYGTYGPAPELDGADRDPIADAKMIEDYFAHIRKFEKNEGADK